MGEEPVFSFLSPPSHLLWFLYLRGAARDGSECGPTQNCKFTENKTILSGIISIVCKFTENMMRFFVCDYVSQCI